MKKRILIVEKEPLNQKLLANMLKNENFDLVFIQRGHEALELIKNTRFEMVLTSAEIYELDGITLGQEIRKFNDKIPVVLMYTILPSKFPEEIFNDRIQIPIHRPMLLNIINDLLN